MDINFDSVEELSLSEIDIEHFANDETFQNRCIEFIRRGEKLRIIFNGRDLRLESEKKKEVTNDT